jgi:hypothetical protein
MKRALFGAAILWVFVLFLVVPQAIHAIPITGNTAASTEGLGNFTGTLTYTYTDGFSATLRVQLTNTTFVGWGGFLTGFVFNKPYPIIPVIVRSDSHPSFHLLGVSGSDNSISAPPFGDFDIGAALGADFLGSGSPNAGIAAGATGIFEFLFTGTDLDSLTDQSFVDLSSENGDESAFFLARFRGIETGAGSDKVPGIVTTAAAPVPEPATLLLLGSGLIALAALGRKKFFKKNR